MTAEPHADARIETLIDVLAQLSTLLGEETAAVRARDYRRLEGLTERKGQLAATYGRALGGLAPHHRAGRGIEVRLSARLRTRAREFMASLETNAHALGAAKTAHERLIRSISEAVAATARPARGYSRSGAWRAGGRPGRTEMVPIALNRKV